MPRKFLSGLNLFGQRIQNVADATDPSDAVTLAQLMNFINGLAWKAPVRVATTTNITLSGTQTIDTIAVAVGDRVLVKDQTDPKQNGIYVVASSAWSRSPDADSGPELKSATVSVAEGSTDQADRAFTQTADNISLGTTSITWVRTSTGIAYLAGLGLELSGTTFSAKRKSGGGVGADTDGLFVDLAALGLRVPYSADIPGNGSQQSITMTHNLGTKDLIGQVRATSNDEVVEVDMFFLTVNTVQLFFGTAPTSPGQYRLNLR